MHTEHHLRMRSLAYLHDIQGWLVAERIRDLKEALVEYEAAKAGFRSDQPRVPSGSSEGGQWTSGGGGGGGVSGNGSDNRQSTPRSNAKPAKKPSPAKPAANKPRQPLVWQGDPLNGQADPVYLFETLTGAVGALRTGAARILGGSATAESASVGAVGKITISSKRSSHIFKNKSGHLPDTSANRKILTDLANDPKAILGPDKYGKMWSSRILPDGKQVWTTSRNGEIISGGVNSIPKQYNPQTGLSAPVRSGWKGWHIW